MSNNDTYAPYSPMLNPIELCFSKVKSATRQHVHEYIVDLAFRTVTALPGPDVREIFSLVHWKSPIYVEAEPIALNEDDESIVHGLVQRR